MTTNISEVQPFGMTSLHWHSYEAFPCRLKVQNSIPCWSSRLNGEIWPVDTAIETLEFTFEYLSTILTFPTAYIPVIR